MRKKDIQFLFSKSYLDGRSAQVFALENAQGQQVLFYGVLFQDRRPLCWVTGASADEAVLRARRTNGGRKDYAIPWTLMPLWGRKVRGGAE